MTPIYYHPSQETTYEWISVAKIPAYVQQSGRDHEEFRPFDIGDLYAAHDPDFVRSVFAGETANGFGNTRADVNESLLASNASMYYAAMHALETGRVANSASQGFHHSHYSRCHGFCTFNGLMITTMRLLDERAVQNVLIVDGDAHVGDGTRDIINRMHVGGQVTNHDRVHFIEYTRPNWNLSEWMHYFDNLLRGTRAGIIMYQAGADAWEYDPLQAGYLSKEALATRDRALFTTARDQGIPLVWNLAGGYADPMQDTIDIHLQTLAISDEVYYERRKHTAQDVRGQQEPLAG